MNMNNFENSTQIFLSPGDLVVVKHNIENKPKMFIVEKVSKNVRTTDNEVQPMFMGMKCRWFDNNGDLQECVFSTKDLMLVEE